MKFDPKARKAIDALVAEGLDRERVEQIAARAVTLAETVDTRIEHAREQGRQAAIHLTRLDAIERFVRSNDRLGYGIAKGPEVDTLRMLTDLKIDVPAGGDIWERVAVTIPIMIEGLRALLQLYVRVGKDARRIFAGSRKLDAADAAVRALARDVRAASPDHSPHYYTEVAALASALLGSTYSYGDVSHIVNRKLTGGDPAFKPGWAPYTVEEQLNTSALRRRRGGRAEGAGR